MQTAVFPVGDFLLNTDIDRADQGRKYSLVFIVMLFIYCGGRMQINCYISLYFVLVKEIAFEDEAA